MAPLTLASTHPDVRWSVETTLMGDEPSPRERASRRVWAAVNGRRGASDAAPGTVALTTSAGTLLLARRGERIGAVLLRPGAVVSVARYELHEALAHASDGP